MLGRVRSSQPGLPGTVVAGIVMIEVPRVRSRGTVDRRRAALSLQLKAAAQKRLRCQVQSLGIGLGVEAGRLLAASRFFLIKSRSSNLRR